MASSNTDVEGLKGAEDALRKSEQRWRAVFDNSRVGVALIDSSTRFVDANPVYLNMVGYTLEELRSMTCLEMTHEETRPIYKALIDELREGKRDSFEIEKRVYRKDGETIWVRVNASSLSAFEPKLWVAMVEDITERKHLRDQVQRERDRLRLLLNLQQHFASKLEIREFFRAAATGLQQLEGWKWSTIMLPEVSTGRMQVFLNGGSDAPIEEGLFIPIEGTISGSVYKSGQPLIFRFNELHSFSPVYTEAPWVQDILRSKLRTGCGLPLVQDSVVLGVMVLGTRADEESAKADLSFLQELARLIATSLSNALRYDQVNASRERLANAKNYIEDQIRTEFSFEKIIGASEALRKVMKQVDQVSPTDSTVLILGETGTGKELIARAIHDRSARRDQSFIKVDCSVIPGSLMESELFGHEKGAFTGATAQRLGRFEIADKGTLFLDEVGDIPLELQPKLLRVLQDQAFERLGSNRTRRLDVRIVAATNRNLEQMVQKGEFREDLYYRLRVFPIIIPPLRERPEDIAPLVQHYVAKYAQRMKKQITTIPPFTMAVLTRYPWPGNIRELQHFLERSVVLSSGTVLQAPLEDLERIIREKSASTPTTSRTMEDIERESILQALRESGGMVGGPNGAAAKLGLKRTTLASRMERLGISRSADGTKIRKLQ